MLSKKEIICPESLLKIAKTKGPAKAVIVNAVKPVAIESAKQDRKRVGDRMRLIRMYIHRIVRFASKIP